MYQPLFCQRQLSVALYSTYMYASVQKYTTIYIPRPYNFIPQVISVRGTMLAVVDTASIHTASPSAPVAAPRCTERIKDSSGDGNTRSGK